MWSPLCAAPPTTVEKNLFEETDVKRQTRREVFWRYTRFAPHCAGARPFFMSSSSISNLLDGRLQLSAWASVSAISSSEPRASGGSGGCSYLLRDHLYLI
jgi:hypothetical protein